MARLHCSFMEVFIALAVKEFLSIQVKQQKKAGWYFPFEF